MNPMRSLTTRSDVEPPRNPIKSRSIQSWSFCSKAGLTAALLTEWKDGLSSRWIMRNIRSCGKEPSVQKGMEGRMCNGNPFPRCFNLEAQAGILLVDFQRVKWGDDYFQRTKCILINWGCIVLVSWIWSVVEVWGKRLEDAQKCLTSGRWISVDLDLKKGETHGYLLKKWGDPVTRVPPHF